MAIEAIIKKWGNSLAIILPNELVQEKKLKSNQHILINVSRPVDLDDVSGILPWKESAQKIKDRVRKGWH